MIMYYVIFRENKTVHSITDDKSLIKRLYLSNTSYKKLRDCDCEFKEMLYSSFDTFYHIFKLVEYNGIVMNLQEMEYVRAEINQMATSLEETLNDTVYIIQPCTKSSIIQDIANIKYDMSKAILRSYICNDNTTDFLKEPDVVILNLLNRYNKLIKK